MKNKLSWLLILLSFLLFLSYFGCQTTTSTTTTTTGVPFRFVVMGDSRGESEAVPINVDELAKISNRVAGLEPKPAFVLFTGDLGFSGGANQLNLWKETVFILTSEGISIYPTVGNHELGINPEINQQAYKNAFNLPENGPAGYEELAFSFDYGNSIFVCLDSYYYDGNIVYINMITDAQGNWLKTLLSSVAKTHKFVFVHSPAYPVAQEFNRSLDMWGPTKRDAFWSILDKNNVDMFFSGHDHCYSRWRINQNVNPSWSGGVYQIISGGAGAPLGSKEATVNPDIFKKSYNYVVIDVIDKNVFVNAYDDNGITLDSFSVLK